ncbi:MAG: ATP-binding protein [Actinomycetota bacterium]
MTTDQWTVRLDVPADNRFLHIVRLTAAGAASEAGLDAAEVEDVKIAVDELCSIAMATADPSAVITLQFVAAAGRLQVEASVPTTHELTVDAMGQAILDATVDTFDCHRRDPGGFHLVKSHRGH